MTRARSCPWRTSDQPENSRQGSERYCEANLITSWSSGVCPQVIAPLTDEHTNPVHVPNGRFSTHAFRLAWYCPGAVPNARSKKARTAIYKHPSWMLASESIHSHSEPTLRIWMI